MIVEDILVRLGLCKCLERSIGGLRWHKVLQLIVSIVARAKGRRVIIGGQLVCRTHFQFLTNHGKLFTWTLLLNFLALRVVKPC